MRWACEYANFATHIDEAVIDIILDRQLLCITDESLFAKEILSGGTNPF